MAEHARMRRIGDPVVAAAPSGMRIRTRLRPSTEEAAVADRNRNVSWVAVSPHQDPTAGDASGNPIGEPVTIDVSTSGLRASRRDGRVRAAITAVLDHAEHQKCAAIVVENLDFADARITGKETLGRGKRGKRLRRTIAGIPTRRFRDRLTAMAARRGIAVIGVDPAYTSRWGNQHWRKPLQQQTPDPSTVIGHHGAAAAIGRRGLGLTIRRRPAGPRNRQRTAAGTPPARPQRRPSTTHSGCGSSGPPTHPPRGVPVHRKTPTRRGQHRSDRAGLTPTQ